MTELHILIIEDHGKRRIWCADTEAEVWQETESAYPALYATTRHAVSLDEYVKAARAWFEALLALDPALRIIYYRNPTPTEATAAP
jgi:hypothetical protein